MEVAKEVLQIAHILKQEGHSAYLVGGCLRDLLLNKEPNDWDLTTDAKPEEIQKIFPESVYENEFGTVGVKTDSEDPRLKIVEVTTFRIEEGYSNKRHPDSVSFSTDINDDLSRRDFTVNAIALDLNANDPITDPFEGQKDLKDEVLRAVGDPDQRFKEDALRLLRAVRFSAQLDFAIEQETFKAIKENAALLEHVSKERIRIEFEKLIMTDKAEQALILLQELGLLQYIIPELEEGVGVEQNMHHKYTVFEHNVKSLGYAVKQNMPLELRLAALLHDVGKPATREWKDYAKGEKIKDGKKGDWTFYSHQVVGAKMTEKILRRLTFPAKLIEKVSLLVYEHMFVYDPDAVTLAGVRRLISRVGKENMEDLILLREADRIGSGVPKAQPYRLRHLQAMVEKVSTDPVSVKMLKVNGQDLMSAGVEPGPKMGDILDILLQEVIENPEKNEKEALLARVKELDKMNENELSKMAHQAQETATKKQEEIDEDIKKKYFV
ncbi:MAG: HD domain-containing protein [Candidatus Paceibacterota bacterium]